jgi:hypothetical protein
MVKVSDLLAASDEQDANSLGGRLEETAEDTRRIRQAALGFSDSQWRADAQQWFHLDPHGIRESLAVVRGQFQLPAAPLPEIGKLVREQDALLRAFWVPEVSSHLRPTIEGAMEQMRAAASHLDGGAAIGEGLRGLARLSDAVAFDSSRWANGLGPALLGADLGRAVDQATESLKFGLGTITDATAKSYHADLERFCTDWLTGQQAIRDRWLAPGTFTGDVFLISWVEEGADPEQQLAVLDRLIKTYFTKRHVFHVNRWVAGGPLDRAFRRQRGDQSFGTAWRDLVLPYLWDIIRDLPEELPVTEMHAHIRRELRRKIELDLLGRTTDTRAQNEALDEFSLPVPTDVIALAELRLDVLAALGTFPSKDADLLYGYYGQGRTAEDLAKEYHLTPGAFRQRISRARRTFSGRFTQALS